MKEKWKTWWWYHWGHVLIAATAVAVILYAFLPGLLTPKPDYNVGVISLYGLPDESIVELEERIRSVADDINGDGRVLVRINLFMVDLSGKTEGTLNYNEAAKLDADLVGNVSSIFLIDDLEGFRQNIAIPIESGALCRSLPFFDGIALPEGMLFTVRSDSTSRADSGLYKRILYDR